MSKIFGANQLLFLLFHIFRLAWGRPEKSLKKNKFKGEKQTKCKEQILVSKCYHLVFPL